MLTAAKIRKLPPGQHGVGERLYVYVGAQGSRYKARVMFDGVQQTVDIGSVDEITLDDARASVAAILARNADGDAPTVQKTGFVNRAKVQKRGSVNRSPGRDQAAKPAGENPFLGPIGRELLGAST